MIPTNFSMKNSMNKTKPYRSYTQPDIGSGFVHTQSQDT